MSINFDHEFEIKLKQISDKLGLTKSEARKIIYKLSDEPYEYSINGLYYMSMKGKDIRNLL